MATGTNGIVTRGELVQHYGTIRLISGLSTTDKQCCTGSWIRSVLNQSSAWNNTNKYSDDQCVLCSDCWSGSTNFIVMNKYYAEGAMVITNTSLVTSGWSLMVSASGTGNSSVNTAFHLDHTKAKVDASQWRTNYVANYSNFWGTETNCTNVTFTFYVTGSNVKNSYISNTCTLTPKATGKLVLTAYFTISSGKISAVGCSARYA